MKLVFISDLHLSDKTPEHNKIFLNLMTKWQNELDALYILGDFFDGRGNVTEKISIRSAVPLRCS